MFKFSFNSTTLRYMEIFEALSQIQAYGYDGVELMLNDSHLHPLRTPESRVSEIADFCSGQGIQIVCVAAGGDRLLSNVPYQPSLIAREESGRRKRIDMLKRSIGIAEVLGSPVLNFNSGLPEEGISQSEAWNHLREGVSQLLQHNGDLVLALEPEPGFFIGTTTDALALIREIDNPKFCLNLDIGHVNCSEDDCYAAIQRAVPFARHIHIEDIKQRVHRHEIPGEGDIDFARVFAALEGAHYEHYVSVELHHHAEIWQRALGESLQYLRGLSEGRA